MFDKKYWVWLSLAFDVANAISDKLLFDFGGDPEAIYRAAPSELMQSLPNGSPVLNKLSNKSLDEAERILDFCEANNVGLLTADSRRYPKMLLGIMGKPIVIYYRGILPSFGEKLSIGVVGTRKVSNYGSQAAYSISYDLAKHGVTIISGMALGTDGSAHVGALDAMGSTVAVLGSGINVVYPKDNERIYYELLTRGTVMTEYPPFSRPEGWHFPQRNRIISGLSSGVLVVEAAEKSGALITAEHAKKQGKLIYAVPGKVGEFNSLGTNALIRSGAKMVTCANDILEDFGSLFDLSPIHTDNSRRSPKRLEHSVYNKELSDKASYEQIDPKSLKVARPYVPLTSELFADDSSYMSMSVDPRLEAARKAYNDQFKLETEQELEYPQQELTDKGYEATPYWELPKPQIKERSDRVPPRKEALPSQRKRRVFSKQASKATVAANKDKLSELSDNQRLIVEFIEKHGKATADELTATGLAVHVLLSQITMLEIDGIIEQISGGYYILK